MDGPNLPHGGSLHTPLKRTSVHPKAEGPLKDISWPSKMGTLETLGLDPKNTKTSQEARPRLPRNSSPAVVMLHPELGSPVFLPRIIPKLPAEAVSSTGRVWPNPHDGEGGSFCRAAEMGQSVLVVCF